MNRNQRLYRQFASLIIPKGRSTIRPLYRLFQIAIIAIGCVFIINLFSLGRSTFGEWGDFFGGVLNPILTFLTFMGLLITIVIQQTELRESRIELRRSADALLEQSQSLKRQNFESTFFQMLSVHTGIVEAIDLANDKGVITRGRDCFSVFYARLGKGYQQSRRELGHEVPDIEALCGSYRNFWKEHQVELGHYFRYLYNVIRFIKESNFVDGPYLRLVRAQLSDQELLLLFYNCVASEHGDRFKQLVEEFSILDNMPRGLLLNRKHLELIDSRAFVRASDA